MKCKSRLIFTALITLCLIPEVLSAQTTKSKDVNAISSSAEQASSTPQKSSEPNIYTDKKTKLSAKLPAGWLARDLSEGKPENILSRILFEAPGAPAPSCIATVGVSSESRKISQANINKAIHSKQSIDKLRQDVARGGQKVLKSNKITRGNIAGLSFELLVEQPNIQPNVRTQLNIFETSGKRWQIVCNTFDYEFEQIKPMFDEFMDGVTIPQ